jgi:hypothetical protein
MNGAEGGPDIEHVLESSEIGCNVELLGHVEWFVQIPQPIRARVAPVN